MWMYIQTYNMLAVVWVWICAYVHVYECTKFIPSAALNRSAEMYNHSFNESPTFDDVWSQNNNVALDRSTETYNHSFNESPAFDYQAFDLEYDVYSDDIQPRPLSSYPGQHGFTTQCLSQHGPTRFYPVQYGWPSRRPSCFVPLHPDLAVEKYAALKHQLLWPGLQLNLHVSLRTKKDKRYVSLIAKNFLYIIVYVSKFLPTFYIYASSIFFLFSIEFDCIRCRF